MASSASASGDTSGLSSRSTLTALSSDLNCRLHLLLFDSQHYSERKDSRDRLESVIDIHWIGSPYFNEAETEEIKKLTTTTMNQLSEFIDEEISRRLQRRMKKRVESGDFRVCAAHDLAPTFAKALNIDLKRLVKDKSFLRLVNQKGLELGDEKWNGLWSKFFAPKHKGRRKR